MTAVCLRNRYDAYLGHEGTGPFDARWPFVASDDGDEEFVSPATVVRDPRKSASTDEDAAGP